MAQDDSNRPATDKLVRRACSVDVRVRLSLLSADRVGGIGRASVTLPGVYGIVSLVDI